MPPPLRWDPVGSGERNWEAVLLTFALTRAGEAALVPPALISALTHRPEPVSLPVSWEWRADAFRFVSVAIARDANAGQHALGKVLVAGLDARRGRRIAVVVKESEWPCLVSAIATSLGTTVGNPEKIAHYLSRSAELVEEIPDAHDHIFGRAYESWLPDLSNPPRLVVLERSPAIDIIAEENEFELYAPRIRASLRRWSRLRSVFADEFFLGGTEVEWYGEFQRFPVLTIPQACAESAEGAVDLEVVARTIVPLYLTPIVAPDEPDGAQVRAAVWLREVDRELRLEYGVWEVVGSVVVRILGAVAPAADVPHGRARLWL